jgi:hypothetical protein
VSAVSESPACESPVSPADVQALVLFFSDWSSAFAAVFADLSALCAAALPFESPVSESFSEAVALVSELSSVASPLVQEVFAFGLESLEPSSLLLEAMALTHWPCTPPAPCGQVVRAADATVSP